MGLLIYGTERIPGVTHVEVTTREQQAPPVRTNPETTRNDRQGLRQAKFSTAVGGLGIRRGTEVSTDLTRLSYSDGPWSHIAQGLFLPPAVSGQNFSAHDVDAERAANRNVLAVQSTLGQSKSRPYFFVNRDGGAASFLRSVSDSNPALEDTGYDFNQGITAFAEGKLNNTRGLIAASGGATDDVWFITDPTTSLPTGTTAFALNAGDRIDAIIYKPLLGPGFNIFVGKILGVTGIFYLRTDEALLTSPHVLVVTSTKDVENPNTATTTTSAKFPTVFGSDVTTGDHKEPEVIDTVQDSGWSHTRNWSSLSSVGASDNVYAVAAAVFKLLSPNTNAVTAPKGVSTPVGQLSGFDFDEIGLAEIITGITVAIEHKEAADAEDWLMNLIHPTVRGSRVGHQLALGHEPSTSDGTVTLGSSTSRYGTNLKGADVRYTFGIDMQYTCYKEFTDDADTSYTAELSVDGLTVALTSKPLGTQAVLPLGGDWVGHHPTKPNNAYVLAPEFQDDATGRNVPRILWELELSYDDDGDRPTVELLKPNIGGMSHVESACIAQATVILSGANANGPGRIVRRLRPDNVPEDMQFASAQGYTEDWKIVNLEGNDKAFWATVSLEANTTYQRWICVNGAWSAYSTRHTSAALPLRMIGDPIDPTQRYSYIFSPTVGGDQLDVRRQFLALNPLSDPLVNNTTIVKSDGPIIVRYPELDLLGPEEGLKVFLNAWYLGRDISSSNTVRLRYSIDGGANFTTWTTYTSALSKSTLSTPVLYRTAIIEIGLDHTASSTGTPNGLPILIEGVAIWASLRKYRAYLNPSDPQFREKYPTGIEGLWSALSAIEALGPVNTLRTGNGASAKALWSRLQSAYNASNDPVNQRGSAANPIDPIHYLEFDEVA